MDPLVILWVFAPAGLANMSPVVARKFRFLDKLAYPLDGGRQFRGKRILGDHKTMLGLLAGMAGGLLGAAIQAGIFALAGWPETAPVNYGSASCLLFGLSIGFGAIAGDGIKSFFKRQAGIAPGKNWFPFDQIDFAIGAVIASWPFFRLQWQEYALVLVVMVVLHPVINVASWLLHFQNKPL